MKQSKSNNNKLIAMKNGGENGVRDGYIDRCNNITVAGV